MPPPPRHFFISVHFSRLKLLYFASAESRRHRLPGRKCLTRGKRRKPILLASLSVNPNDDAGRTVSFRAEGKCHSHSKQDGLGVRSINEDQFLGERRQLHRCNQHAGRYKRPQDRHKPACLAYKAPAANSFPEAARSRTGRPGKFTQSRRISILPRGSNRVRP
jgi:hypothetical protein